MPAARYVLNRSALAAELCPGKNCLEVGVSFGEHAAVMLAAGPTRLYLVDPWCWQDPALDRYVERWYGGDSQKATNTRMEAEYRSVVLRFKDDPRVELMRTTSLDAASRFGDGSLDVVYIDGIHSEKAVSADARAWWPKVAVGGWLYGHDYDPYHAGVVRAVRGFVAELGRKQLDVLTTQGKRGVAQSWGLRKDA